MTTIAALVALSAPAGMTPAIVDGVEVHPRNLILKIENKAVLDHLRVSGVKVVKYLPKISWAIVEAPVGKLQATRKRLSGFKGVESCELDGVAKPCFTPNDFYWSYQWHLRQLKVDQAWDTTLGTAQPIVAVVDTGVNVNHEDLVQNIYTNPGEIPGNGIDDEGNGYVDDVHGWDFGENDADVSETNQVGHGTLMAGVIAARGNNTIGISGVAPLARILPIKYTGGADTVSAIAEGCMYAADMGARVFSLALATPEPSDALEDALKYCYQKGAVLVAASGGNPFQDRYPAAYDFVIAVGSCDEFGNKRGYSPIAPYVDVVAPSDGVFMSTRADGFYWAYTGGTSMASAEIAGVAALLKGAKYSASRARIQSLILDTAQIVVDPAVGEYSNYGLVDAKSAMDHLIANTSPAPHPSAVRFVTPFVFGNNGKATVYGRGLQDAVVKINGVAATMVSTGRDKAVFKLKPYTGPMTIEDSSGNLLATYVSPSGTTRIWPMMQAYGVGGSSARGGLYEALNADGVNVTAIWTNDGKEVGFTGVFHAMPTSGPMKLFIKRSYVKDKYGTEKVRIESFDPDIPDLELSSRTAPIAGTDMIFTIPDITPYVNANGMAEVSIRLSGSPKTTVLNLDQAYFKK